LQTVELANERVITRVSEGGHPIPAEVIERRYSNGIKNLFSIYMPIVDKLMIFANSQLSSK
jgi:predicted ABC-type ATPase